jgi:hypothetical protein
MRAKMIRIMPRVMPPLLPTHARAGRRLARALAVCATLGLAPAGCGESSATYRSSLVRLTVGEYTLTPEAAQVFAGRVRLRLRNDGVLVHEVAVADADGHILGQTAAVFPGKTVTSKPFELAPGTYRTYDYGANYADLGAYGSLRVVARRCGARSCSR